MEEEEVEKDVAKMLKKVIVMDFILGITITILIYNIFKNYAFIFLLGLAIALLNFALNSYLTSIALTKNKQLLTFLGFILRIGLACIAAIIVLKYNAFNVFPFAIGYSSHYISLVLYGISLKDN